MKFHTQQLPNGRWGIYKELQLMATVGDSKACNEILNCLKSSGKKKPKQIDILTKFSKTTHDQSSSIKKIRTKKTRRISA